MSVLFVTGAGISANAGIPTYRDSGSSWRDKDLESKSHSSRYEEHLDELWSKHWGPLSEAMRAAEPTYTHKAIAAFQKNNEAIIATQNIEDLHERAGSDNVAHLHGSLNPICMLCDSKSIEPWSEGMGSPMCLRCDSPKTRPDVVLFGESLSERLMQALNTYAQSVDAVVAIGTSLNVFPSTGLVMDNTVKAIIINKEPTMLDRWVHKVYNEDCDEVIDKVLEMVDTSTQSLL